MCSSKLNSTFQVREMFSDSLIEIAELTIFEDVIDWIKNPENCVLNSYVALSNEQRQILRFVVDGLLRRTYGDPEFLNLIFQDYKTSPFDLFRLVRFFLMCDADGSRLKTTEEAKASGGGI